MSASTLLFSAMLSICTQMAIAQVYHSEDSLYRWLKHLECQSKPPFDSSQHMEQDSINKNMTLRKTDDWSYPGSGQFHSNTVTVNAMLSVSGRNGNSDSAVTPHDS